MSWKTAIYSVRPVHSRLLRNGREWLLCAATRPIRLRRVLARHRTLPYKDVPSRAQTASMCFMCAWIFVVQKRTFIVPLRTDQIDSEIINKSKRFSFSPQHLRQFIVDEARMERERNARGTRAALKCLLYNIQYSVQYTRTLESTINELWRRVLAIFGNIWLLLNI